MSLHHLKLQQKKSTAISGKIQAFFEKTDYLSFLELIIFETLF
jgi:hypothetical protein